MLDHGALADVPYTLKDLRNHREIAGPCEACLMSKAKHLPTPDISCTSAELGELLVLLSRRRRTHGAILPSIESRTGHLQVPSPQHGRQDLRIATERNRARSSLLHWPRTHRQNHQDGPLGQFHFM